MGVFAALLRFFEDSFKTTLIPDLTKLAGLGPFLDSWGNWLGLVAFFGLGAFVYASSLKAKAVEG